MQRPHKVESEEVLCSSVCRSFHSDELLQPRCSLSAELRFLFLLRKGRFQNAKAILAMQKDGKKGQGRLEDTVLPLHAAGIPGLLGCVCYVIVF